MGVVYDAEDTRLKRKVAMELDPDFALAHVQRSAAPGFAKLAS